MNLPQSLPKAAMAVNVGCMLSGQGLTEMHHQTILLFPYKQSPANTDVK